MNLKRIARGGGIKSREEFIYESLKKIDVKQIKTMRNNDAPATRVQNNLIKEIRNSLN